MLFVSLPCEYIALLLKKRVLKNNGHNLLIISVPNRRKLLYEGNRLSPFEHFPKDFMRRDIVKHSIYESTPQQDPYYIP